MYQNLQWNNTIDKTIKEERKKINKNEKLCTKGKKTIETIETNDWFYEKKKTHTGTE